MDIELVTRALVEISYSGGNKRLKMVQEFNVDLNHADTKVVKTMNPENEGIGFTDGIMDVSADMKVVVEMGTPEVDYEELLRRREIILFTYEEAGANAAGARKTLKSARITNVSSPFSSNGEVVRSVKLLALGHRPEEASGR